MANAAVATPTVVNQYADSNYHVTGTIAIDASPLEYRTGGLVLNMNQAAIKASRKPLRVTISGIAGYVYSYSPGTDNSDGKLMIFAQTASASEDDPLGQLANAVAIPAACSGDTLSFTAAYKGME